MSAPSSELHELDATALSAALAAGDVSCEALMAHTLERVAALNPSLNAIVSPRPAEELMAEARRADATPAIGWLHGVPLAVKDLADTAGLRTTYGSPLFARHVPSSDAPLVRRLRAAGAIVIGKTNTPEFGLGSQTYNPVHGTTRNPYDLARTPGGSSGGAAAALAARLVTVADGSDMMGSLRNPAAFCNVYGLRPSVGLVPGDPARETGTYPLSTDGPMARSVRDLARLLDTLSADEPRLPWGAGRPAGAPGSLVAALVDDAGEASPLAGRRLAWLADLDGHLPMAPEVLGLCEDALRVFESLGATVEPLRLAIDPEELWRAWTVLRSAAVAATLGLHHDDPSTRARLKPEACWEIERGRALSAADVHEAAVVRARWYAEAAERFERFDALVLPSAQVLPFDAACHWPSRVDERAMRTYHEWMAVVVPASMGGLPALAVPAGFAPTTASLRTALPAGMQLIGRRFGDAGLLHLGEAYHRVTDWPGRVPPPGPTGTGDVAHGAP